MSKNKLQLKLKEARWALNPPISSKKRVREGSAAAGVDVAAALAHLEQQGEEQQASRFSFIATYSSLLRRCANAGSFPDGKRVHDHICRSGYACNVVLAELLILMYGKCKRLQEARSVFDQMPKRSVYSWNLMLGAYVENGFAARAIDLYRGMDLEPDKFTFSTVLIACSNLGFLSEGKLIHEQMNSRNELVPDSVSNNSLITMYAKCGSMIDAKAVFDGIQEKSLVAWNCMMSAFAQHGESRKAVDLYHQMDSEGLQPNMISFSTVLSACSNLGREALEIGKQIHAQLIASQLQRNVIVDTALLSMYGNCGSSEDAERIFSGMRERNVVSWTVMISTLSQSGRNRDALRLLMKMDLEGVHPNACTLTCVLAACANLGSLEIGKAIHSRAVLSGFDSEMGLQNALINMYAKCDRLDVAKQLFDGIASKTDVSWNAMIAAYVQHGCNQEAFDVYQSREEEGEPPNDFIFASVLGACSTVEEIARIHALVAASKYRSDVVIHNSLIKMYAKLGSAELARKTFDEMADRDGASWNGMIIAYLQHGYSLEALEIYGRMQSENVQPNAITFSNVLTACLLSGSVEVGLRTHQEVCKLGLQKTDAIVGTVLVNMFAKFGDLVAAREVFDNLEDKNIISWNAMVMAYAQNGQHCDAIDVFQNIFLDGLHPDNISFTCIFHALSHAGFLDRGKECFLSMGPDHALTPTLDHYVSMIDLLGRSGRLKDAEILIDEMPFEPDIMSWMTLLGGCKMHGNIERGQVAAERTVELDPEDSSPYILLSNMYSAWIGKLIDAESLEAVS